MPENTGTIKPRAVHQDRTESVSSNQAMHHREDLPSGASPASPGTAFHSQSWHRPALTVGAALVAALAVDWLLAPASYPVAAAYGVALLLAARLLAPRGVAMTAVAALVLSIASNAFQQAPTMAAVADNAGLLAIGLLAYLVARQRQLSEAARRRLELQYAAARALAEETTIETAASTILAAIAGHLGGAGGALWVLDNDAEALTCLATWRPQEMERDRFEERTRTTQFARGVGLPGRVWDEGRPVWVRDVQQTANFPRQAAAQEASLHAGLAFPVRHGDDLLGVIEFFSSEIRQPDDAILALLDAVGVQLGLFMARRRAEDQVGMLLHREQYAREHAEAAVRVRDRFLASVSHDLRSPLSAIQGYAQLAQRRVRQLPEPGAESLHRPLESIQLAVKRMTAALDELLDLAQLQIGHPLTLRRGLTDLVAITRRAVADQQADSTTPRIEVSTDLNNLIGFWDAARIERVLSNLLSNAIKYSPGGDDIQVTIRRRNAGEQEIAELQVVDHGIGIPEADLPHVFEPFWRAKNASQTFAGTGLGLPGSREVVEQHGGRISVQSREGEGSTFTVELPVSDETFKAGAVSGEDDTETSKPS